jgi:hypothetical protein
MKKSPLLFSNIQDFMSEPKVHTFSSETEWKSAAADEILRDAPEDMRIALSGGSTPAPVYEELATRRQDWSKSHVFVVDERFVPGDHPDSNQKLIKEHFPPMRSIIFGTRKKAMTGKNPQKNTIKCCPRLFDHLMLLCSESDLMGTRHLFFQAALLTIARDHWQSLLQLMSLPFKNALP